MSIYTPMLLRRSAAQRRLEKTTAEIKEFYEKAAGHTHFHDFQELKFERQQVQVLPLASDSAIDPTVDKMKDLHRLAENRRAQTAILLERYSGFKEKVKKVINRLDMVENRLDKLEATARSERLAHLELLKHSSRFFQQPGLEDPKSTVIYSC